MAVSNDCQVVIVALGSLAPYIESCLNKISGRSWRRSQSITLISVPEPIRRSKVATSAFVEAECGDAAGLKFVLAFGTAELCQFEIQRNHSIFQRAYHRDEFVRKLTRILEILSLDLVGRVSATLTSWSHCKIDSNRVHCWLRQFSAYSHQAEGVGRHLLDVLSFYPSHRCAENLNVDLDALANFDWIAVFDSSGGRSAAIIKNLAKHQIEKLDITKLGKLTELAGKIPTKGKYLVLEDCIFSGTQVANFIGHNTRVMFFDDPYMNQVFDLTVRCCVVTRLGYLRLTEYFKRRNVLNVHIDVPPSGMVENVTEAGLAAASNGTLFDDSLNVIDQERYVIPEFALRCKERGLSVIEISSIRQTCGAIGSQLMETYLARQQMRMEDLPSYWALGAFGLGMVTVFSHSTATSCLPVFCREGLVRRRGREISWLPLFA